MNRRPATASWSAIPSKSTKPCIPSCSRNGASPSTRWGRGNGAGRRRPAAPTVRSPAISSSTTAATAGRSRHRGCSAAGPAPPAAAGSSTATGGSSGCPIFTWKPLPKARLSSFAAAPAEGMARPSSAIPPYDEGPYKAMEVAIDEINAKGGVLGRQLKLISSDTKSDISYGATAAQEVIDKGATLVVVTCDYDFGSAAANVANSKNLIAFSTCAGDPKFGPSGIGPNAFTMATGSPGQAALMAEFAFKQGWKKAFILRDTSTAFEASFSATFQKRWKELAGADNFLGEDTFGAEDPQIATQITRIKALAAQPDFIVMCSYPPQGASAIRQVRAAGLNQPILGSEDWDGDFWTDAIPGLTGLYFDTYASVFDTDPRP